MDYDDDGDDDAHDDDDDDNVPVMMMVVRCLIFRVELLTNLPEGAGI